jgi:dUTP pyrophosphatase
MKAKKLNNKAVLPVQKHTGDAGYDLFAIKDCWILPKCRKTISLGVAIELPLDTVGLMFPRSSSSIKHGLTVFANVIDASYRGEIHACIYNSSWKPYRIARGDRVAQLVIVKYISNKFIFSNALSGSDRGARGVGSTGK